MVFGLMVATTPEADAATPRANPYARCNDGGISFMPGVTGIDIQPNLVGHSYKTEHYAWAVQPQKYVGYGNWKSVGTYSGTARVGSGIHIPVQQNSYYQVWFGMSYYDNYGNLKQWSGFVRTAGSDDGQTGWCKF
jgi:hypothetical protein